MTIFFVSIANLPRLTKKILKPEISVFNAFSQVKIEWKLKKFIIILIIVSKAIIV